MHRAPNSPVTSTPDVSWPDGAVLLCPSALTNPVLLDSVLSVLPDKSLVAISVQVSQHEKRRYQAGILAELRTATSKAIEDGETDSNADVIRVRISSADWDANPTVWSDTGLTLYHADGAQTRNFDASHTELETLLPNLTCVDQPASGDSFTVNLLTGKFSR